MRLVERETKLEFATSSLEVWCMQFVLRRVSQVVVP